MSVASQLGVMWTLMYQHSTVRLEILSDSSTCCAVYPKLDALTSVESGLANEATDGRTLPPPVLLADYHLLSGAVKGPQGENSTHI